MTRMVRAKRPSTTSYDRALTTPQYSFHWESDRQVQLPGPLIVQPWRLALHAAKETRVQTVCHLRRGWRRD